MIRFPSFIICLMASWPVDAQPDFVKRDLSPDWWMYVSDSLVPFDARSNTKAVYLRVDPCLFRGDDLVIESQGEFSVMLNDEMVSTHVKSLRLSMDSIIRHQSCRNMLRIGIYQKQGIHNSLTTHIRSDLSLTNTSVIGPLPREGNDLKDFALVAFLFLLVLFAGMLRFNPRLTAQYFSFSGIFLQRESEEVQAVSRISNSSNLWFYAFAGLVSSYAILLNSLSSAALFTRYSAFINSQFWLSIWLWFELGLIVAFFLFTKALMVSVFSRLYGMKDVSGFQFFNFVRVVLIVMSLLAGVTVSLVLFSVELGVSSSLVFGAMRWVLAGWIVLCFFKLSKRVSFSAFHLFSYICLTEIVPFFLIVTLLYE